MFSFSLAHPELDKPSVPHPQNHLSENNHPVCQLASNIVMVALKTHSQTKGRGGCNNFTIFVQRSKKASWVPAYQGEPYLRVMGRFWKALTSEQRAAYRPEASARRAQDTTNRAPPQSHDRITMAGQKPRKSAKKRSCKATQKVLASSSPPANFLAADDTRPNVADLENMPHTAPTFQGTPSMIARAHMERSPACSSLPQSPCSAMGFLHDSNLRHPLAQVAPSTLTGSAMFVLPNDTEYDTYSEVPSEEAQRLWEADISISHNYWTHLAPPAFTPLESNWYGHFPQNIPHNSAAIGVDPKNVRYTPTAPPIATPPLVPSHRLYESPQWAYEARSPTTGLWTSDTWSSDYDANTPIQVGQACEPSEGVPTAGLLFQPWTPGMHLPQRRYSQASSRASSADPAEAHTPAYNGSPAPVEVKLYTTGTDENAEDNVYHGATGTAWDEFEFHAHKHDANEVQWLPPRCYAYSSHSSSPGGGSLSASAELVW
ncbi:hypothetical protein C2E23DRAFT_455935 [Lenzites betulinus]|nr:hypothetical protein C2E23DRAFT_455935 [Lenzites betulinus]